ncbi:MAG: serine protease [Burkholderia sp.]
MTNLTKNSAGQTAKNLDIMAAHVVDESAAVAVKLADGQMCVAHVAGIDVAHDMTMLRFDGEAGKANHGRADHAEPRSGRVGDWLAQRSGVQRVSAGVVSRYGLDTGLLQTARFMMTDAAIIGGNSGGVVVNTAGNAVGFVSYGYSDRFTQVVPIARDAGRGRAGTPRLVTCRSQQRSRLRLITRRPAPGESSSSYGGHTSRPTGRPKSTSAC